MRLALAGLALALACGQAHSQVARKAEPTTQRERARTEAPLRAPAQVEKAVPRKAERRPPDSAPSQTQQLQQQIEEKRAVDQRNAKNQGKPNLK